MGKENFYKILCNTYIKNESPKKWVKKVIRQSQLTPERPCPFAEIP